MRFHTIVLCLLVASMLCSVTLGADKKKSKPKSYTGTLIKARENTVVFNTPGENGADAHRIFYVNNDTTITLDGKPAKLNDLDTGMTVTVTAKTKNIASSVEATSPPKKGL
jgi:hypothetical protein